jgi:eukaryotic-like serine/threonine-protein kinase
MPEFHQRDISHYRLLRRVGSGGMGVVYEAEDLTLGRRVALKFLPPDHRSSPQAIERFKLEARSASALNHPNICTIYEIGEADGEVFIAMELLQGEPLEEALQHRRLTPAEIVEIGIALADALDAAHTGGIIHRDIKPANIFLTSRRTPKLLDFGLAKPSRMRVARSGNQIVSEGETLEHLTSPGVAVGTVAFMSPEQARGEPLDARTDLFSLGCVLYQMATDELPFGGNTNAVVFDNILNREPTPAIERNPTIPRRLHEIIHTALEKDRELRCQTAAEIRGELKRLKRSSGLERPTATDSSSGQPTKRSGGATQAAASVPAVLLRSRRRVWLSCGAIVAVVAIGAGAWHLRSLQSSGNVFDMSTLRIERVTHDGLASRVGIAPDGRYLAYVQQSGAQQSLWVRQVATGSNIQVVPPDNVGYVGVSFSPDGNYIYFVRSPRTNFAFRTLYVVPTLGGTPRSLIDDVDTAVTFSPDGKRIAFVRGDPPKGVVRLMVANTDGTEVKQLWETPAETARHNAPDWSPDARSIAVATTDRTATTGILTLVNVAGGTARTLYKHTGRMGRGRWRPDGSGLLVPLDDWVGERSQLWLVAFPTGELRRFTNDLSDYALPELDQTADGRTLATIEDVSIADVEVVEWPGGTSKQVTTGGRARSLAWGPHDELYYIITPHAFRTDRLGLRHQQLTPEGTLNTNITACGDGSVLVRRLEGDQSSIWRMESDGNNPRRVVSSGIIVDFACSPDAKWIYYSISDKGSTTAWRTTLDGSAPSAVLQGAGGLNVSPDGSLIATDVWDVNAGRLTTRVIPAEGGEAIRAFRLPPASRGLVWAPDGKALHYGMTSDDVTNIWEQPLTGDQPRQVTHFLDKNFLRFRWSHDGTRLALLRGASQSNVVTLSQFVSDTK